MRTKNFHGARTNIALDSGQKQKGPEVEPLPADISEKDKWKLEGCPRCHGDVFLDSEAGELLGHCLQCGYVGARVIPARLARPTALDFRIYPARFRSDRINI